MMKLEPHWAGIVRAAVGEATLTLVDRHNLA
jgi:hypothetical protein